MLFLLYDYLIFHMIINSTFQIHSSHRSPDIITSDSSSLSTSHSSLSGTSSSTSISTSSSNNINIFQTTLSNYNSLSRYSDNFIPLLNGPTFTDQLTLQSQLDLLTSTSSNGLSYYDTPLPLQQPLTPLTTSPTVLGTCINSPWRSLRFIATAISIGTQGDIYAVGQDGRLYHFDFLDNTWQHISGDYDIGTITKVAVDVDGLPIVVCSNGNVYQINTNNMKWEKLPGCATDISIGRNGDVFKIGCDVRVNGFGVYKLIRDNNNKQRKRSWRCQRENFCVECDTCSDDVSAHDDAYWFRLSGSGVRVSAGPFGNAYVVTASGVLMEYNDGKWKEVLIGANVRDVACSNDNEVYYVDNYANVFRIADRNGHVFQLCGVAKAIDVGPYSQPIVIGIDGDVYTSSKFNFN